ncbi:hypothetical protein HD806DRAFT_547071 [Xylariaceae sp. AK1471]|nr:hypothetical protein HD806DRAFT_547071 [Xylariaceae sp. AK1471]
MALGLRLVRQNKSIKGESPNSSTKYQAHSPEAQDTLAKKNGSFTTTTQSKHEYEQGVIIPVGQLRPRENTSVSRGPLHIAAQSYLDSIVRVLLLHQRNCNERDSHGIASMFHAVMSGHEQVVTTLLEHWARVGNKDEQERAALHLAVENRRETLLEILLQACQIVGVIEFK